MVRTGAKHGFGLEVGSKAELAMVMSILADSPGAILICNGARRAGGRMSRAGRSLRAPMRCVGGSRRAGHRNV